MEAHKSANKKGKNKKKGKTAESSKEEDYDSESSKINKKVVEESVRSSKEEENTKKSAKRKKKPKKGNKALEDGKKSDFKPANSPKLKQCDKDDEKKHEAATLLLGSQSVDKVPEFLINNVLKHSSQLPSTTPIVKGLSLFNITTHLSPYL
jgi:hypothetical protein